MLNSRHQAGDHLAVPEPLGNAVCMVAVVALQHTNLISSLKLHATNRAPTYTDCVTVSLGKTLHCTLQLACKLCSSGCMGMSICAMCLQQLFKSLLQLQNLKQDSRPQGMSNRRHEQSHTSRQSWQDATSSGVQMPIVAHTVRSHLQVMHRHQLQSTHCSVPVSWLWSGLCCAYAVLHKLSMMLWAAPLLTTPTVSPRACSCYTHTHTIYNFSWIICPCTAIKDVSEALYNTHH